MATKDYNLWTNQPATIVCMDSHFITDNTPDKRALGRTVPQTVAATLYQLEILEFSATLPLKTLPGGKRVHRLHKTISVVEPKVNARGTILAFSLDWWRSGMQVRKHVTTPLVDDIKLTIHGTMDIDAKWFNEDFVDVYDGQNPDECLMHPKFVRVLRDRIDSIVDSFDKESFHHADFVIHQKMSQELPDILPGARIDWLDVAVHDKSWYHIYDGPLNV